MHKINQEIGSIDRNWAGVVDLSTERSLGLLSRVIFQAKHVLFPWPQGIDQNSWKKRIFPALADWKMPKWYKNELK